MPLALRALIYVGLFSGLGWAFLIVATRGLVERAELNRFLLAWAIVTPVLFLSPNGAFFLFAAAVLLLALRAAGTDALVLAAFMLATVPPGGVSVGDLPGIKYLLRFTMLIIISMVVLLPYLFRLPPKAPGAVRSYPSARGSEAFLFAYFVLVAVLSFREATFTTGLRSSTEWSFLAVIPYLAFSRGVRDQRHLRRVVGALAISLVLVGVVGIGNAVVSWQFYDLPVFVMFEDTVRAPKYRSGILRVGGTMGGAPISFGLIMVIGACVASTFLTQTGPERQVKRPYVLGMIAICIVAALASGSRGPWIGGVVAIVAYQLTRPNPGPALVKSAAIGAVLFAAALVTETGRSMAAMLPFVGTDQTGTIDYRADLFDAGMAVIQRQPFLGSPSYLEEPEMQAMVQGEGIIDMVNTYLAWSLEFGLIGLALYAVGVSTLLIGTFRITRRLDVQRDAALRAVGAALFAALTAYSVTIATTSLTGILPSLGWIVIGLCAGYMRVAKAALARSAQARPLEAPLVEADRPDRTAPSGPSAPTPPPPTGPGPLVPARKAGSSFGLQSDGGSGLFDDLAAASRPVQ